MPPSKEEREHTEYPCIEIKFNFCIIATLCTATFKLHCQSEIAFSFLHLDLKFELVWTTLSSATLKRSTTSLHKDKIQLLYYSTLCSAIVKLHCQKESMIAFTFLFQTSLKIKFSLVWATLSRATLTKSRTSLYKHQVELLYYSNIVQCHCYKLHCQSEIALSFVHLDITFKLLWAALSSATLKQSTRGLHKIKFKRESVSKNPTRPLMRVTFVFYD